MLYAFLCALCCACVCVCFRIRCTLVFPYGTIRRMLLHQKNLSVLRWRAAEACTLYTILAYVVVFFPRCARESRFLLPSRSVRTTEGWRHAELGVCVVFCLLLRNARRPVRVMLVAPKFHSKIRLWGATCSGYSGCCRGISAYCESFAHTFGDVTGWLAGRHTKNVNKRREKNHE